MQVRGDRRALRHGGHGARVQEEGMRAHEAQARDPRDARGRAQEFREAALPVAPGVDRLPEEGDLPRPPLRAGADLAEDVRQRAAALGAPDRRHDAEAAALVAAARDGDGSQGAAVPEGAGRAPLAGRGPHRDLGPRRERGYGERSGGRECGGEQAGVVLDGARSDHQVHVREAGAEPGPQPFGRAARHDQRPPGARLLPVPQAADQGGRPVLGVLAHRAGVHDHGVGLPDIFGQGIAAREPGTGQLLGVRGRHLAPEGDRVQLHLV